MSYVSKRFRTFRKPITRRRANGGPVGGQMVLVARNGPEIVIPMRTYLTGGTLPRNIIYTTTTFSA